MSKERQLFRCTKEGRYIKCSLSWHNPVSFIEHWAKIKPSKLAIISHANEDLCITCNWGELLRDCLALAKHIKALPNQRIAIVSGSHIITIKSVLASLLAEKEIVLIDLLRETEQLQLYKLLHSGASEMIIPSLTDMPDLLIDRINEIKTKYEHIEIFSVGKNALASKNLPDVVKGKKISRLDYTDNAWNRPSCLIYSPGHHDNPKGFLYTTHAIYANMLAVAKRFEFSSRTRFLLAGEIDSCYGLIPVLSALLSGGTVILCSDINANNFWRIADKTGANVVRFKPSLVELLSCENVNHFYYRCSDLKYAIISGDYLPRRSGLRFYETCDIPLLQCYGTSETGGYVLGPRPGLCNRFYELSLRDDIVGEEFGFCNVKLVSDDKIRSAFDIEEQGGLIHVRGYTVSCGYWTGTEIKLWNKSWLETSDLACRAMSFDMPYYQIKGCVEDALLIDGKILWPMNIEQPILATFPFLNDCIAIATKDNNNRNILSVIAIVSSEISESRRSELLALMQARIAAGGVAGLIEQATPESIVMIEQNNLPRRPDNQIDRQELRTRISKQIQGLAAS